MIRETHNVNISNAECAKIANQAGADIFLRIHANGSINPQIHGIMVICPTSENPFCNYQQSRKLSDCLIKELIAESGAKNCGIGETDTMSDINWSKVPVCILELGFMTNKDEDSILAQKDYQQKLVADITSYF